MLTLYYTLLLLVYFTWSQCSGVDTETGEIFSPPRSRIAAKGENVWFSCYARAVDAFWKIDGIPVQYPGDIESHREGGIFIQPPIHNATDFTFQLSLVVNTTFSGVNNTVITCLAGGNSYSVEEDSTLTVIDPPLPPGWLTVYGYNESSIRFTWEEPFTWPGYPITTYLLQLYNRSSGEVVRQLLNNATTAVITSEGLLVDSCSVIEIKITPISDAGESLSVSYYTGLPKRTVLFSTESVSTSVLFDNRGSPFLHIQATLPAVCYYQEMTYTIVLQPDNNTTAITLSKIVQEGRVSSCPPVPGQSLLQVFEVSEIVPAALGVSYTVHVRADTIAGSSTADPVYISTAVDPPQSSKGKTDHAVYAILGVYSVTVSVLLCVSAVLLCVCNKKSRRFTVNEVGKAQRSMVNNPIYESQTTGPVYECIPLGSSNQQTNCDSPSAISVRYLEQPQKASPVTSSTPSTSTSDDDKSSMLAAESPCMKQQDETALSCGMQVRENFQLRLSRGDTKIHVNGTINLEPLQEPMSPVEDGQSPQTMKGATTTTVLTMQGSTSRRDTAAPVMIPTATRATADANYTIMSPAGTISHSALSAGWGDHSPVDSNKYAFAD